MFFLAARLGAQSAAQSAAATLTAGLSCRHRTIRLARAPGLHAITRARIQELIHFNSRQNLGAAQEFGDQLDAREVLHGLHFEVGLEHVLAVADRKSTRL